MKILMLAPEPFFAPRGTPLSVCARIKALTRLGHMVHLITYHLGENIHLERTKILRTPPLFFIRRVKIGASAAKIPLDFLLLLKASVQLVKEDYDLIFSHEEAALIGVLLAKIWKLPHIYDMHSSLPQHVENLSFLGRRFLKEILLSMEAFILKKTQSVLVISPSLYRRVKEKGYSAKTFLIENFMDLCEPAVAKEQAQRIRKKWAPAGEKIVLYTGNFQSYQGLPLLLEAAVEMKEKYTVFVLVGGTRSQIENMKKRAKALQITDKLRFIGEVPPSEIPLLLSAADALVSARLRGTGIPLKLYSYLRSGKPVVATRLSPHTQILDEKTSILVSPDAKSLAEGLTYALFHPEARIRAQRAKERADREYTSSVYIEKMNEIVRFALSGA